MKRIVAALGLGFVVVPTFVAALFGAASAPSAAAPAAPSAYATADIPPDMLALYQAAAKTCPGLSPWVLAAIGKIETDHGRNVTTSSAGARGPMQFMPDTWKQYGTDGDGDGSADIDSPADAVYSAAKLLCANGAGDPARLRDAIWAYNHAQWYVDEVLDLAARYAASGSATNGAPSTDAKALLDNPNVTLSDNARADLASGTVDQRVVGLLSSLAQRHKIAVSVIRTGHSEYVKGTTRVSNHFYGRAADIYEVDGEAVSPSSAAAKSVVGEILDEPPPLRPDEVGQPFAEETQFAGVFSDADHQDHIHVGWRG